MTDLEISRMVGVLSMVALLVYFTPAVLLVYIGVFVAGAAVGGLVAYWCLHDYIKSLGELNKTLSNRNARLENEMAGLEELGAPRIAAVMQVMETHGKWAALKAIRAMGRQD